MPPETREVRNEARIGWPQNLGSVRHFVLDEVVGPALSLLRTQALVGKVEILSRPVEDDAQTTSLTALAKVGPTAAGG